MKEKQYDPARHNEKAPDAGMAAVDTHNPEEESSNSNTNHMKPEDDDREQVNNLNNDRQ